MVNWSGFTFHGLNCLLELILSQLCFRHNAPVLTGYQDLWTWCVFIIILTGFLNTGLCCCYSPCWGCAFSSRSRLHIRFVRRAVRNDIGEEPSDIPVSMRNEATGGLVVLELDEFTRVRSRSRGGPLAVLRRHPCPRTPGRRLNDPSCYTVRKWLRIRKHPMDSLPWSGHPDTVAWSEYQHYFKTPRKHSCLCGGGRIGITGKHLSPHGEGK